jgi:hypothetical protein
MFPLQVNRGILLVRKSSFAHPTLKSMPNAALKSHVSVQVIVPVVTFAAFLTLKSSLTFTWFNFVLLLWI